MKHAISLSCLVFAFVTSAGVSQASVQIDFDDLALGVLSPGDLLKQVGSFEVTVGNPAGTIANSPALAGGFSGNYLSSDSGTNFGRVDLLFNIPIIGTVSLDANYLVTAGLDFQVVDIRSGPNLVVYDTNDGPNTKFISFELTEASTGLRFRDNNVKPVQIDNLWVSQVVPEPTTFIVWSLLGLTASVISYRRNSKA